MIYFDNASTTAIDSRILKTYDKLLQEYFANPSGAHKLARDINRLQDKSRTEILKSLKYQDGRVIFTSSATEANNLAFYGLFRQYSNRGKEIIISEYEHPSVFNTAKMLEEDYGAIIRYVKVTAQGTVDIEHLKALLSDQTVIVSIMAVNNEIGAINDVKSIAKLVSQYPKAIFHSDVTQAIGKIDIPYDIFDALSFSAHKINGLKGSGALILKNKLILKPLFFGGEQEDGFRAGTSNAPINIVLAQTVRLAIEGQFSNYIKVKELAERLVNKIEGFPKLFVMNSVVENPFIVNFSFINYKASVVLNALENADIFVGTTSSCSVKKHEPSRSIYAMTQNDVRANNSLRVSLSKANTIEEVDHFFEVLLNIIEGENDD